MHKEDCLTVKLMRIRSEIYMGLENLFLWRFPRLGLTFVAGGKSPKFERGLDKYFLVGISQKL